MSEKIGVMLLLGALGLSSSCGGSRPPADPFPRVSGLTFENPPVVYGPSDLFEYINGAAESYLTYGFEGLASQTYLEDGNVALVVDVYRHRDLAHAFGMYAQERPDAGPFIDVGAEGYAQPGVVNFFKGPNYVKIMSYRAADDVDEALLGLAREIADRLPGEATLPAGVALLPANGRIAHSERFIARDFLGHGFLHSAFAAEYSTGDGGSTTGFLLMPDDPGRAGEMFEAYGAYAEERGSVVDREGRITSFVDPYYRSDGSVSLALLDGAVFGMFGLEGDSFEQLADGVRSAMQQASHG